MKNAPEVAAAKYRSLRIANERFEKRSRRSRPSTPSSPTRRWRRWRPTPRRYRISSPGWSPTPSGSRRRPNCRAGELDPRTKLARDLSGATPEAIKDEKGLEADEKRGEIAAADRRADKERIADIAGRFEEGLRDKLGSFLLGEVKGTGKADKTDKARVAKLQEVIGKLLVAEGSTKPEHVAAVAKKAAEMMLDRANQAIQQRATAKGIDRQTAAGELHREGLERDIERDKADEAAGIKRDATLQAAPAEAEAKKRAGGGGGGGRGRRRRGRERAGDARRRRGERGVAAGDLQQEVAGGPGAADVEGGEGEAGQGGDPDGRPAPGCGPARRRPRGRSGPRTSTPTCRRKRRRRRRIRARWTPSAGPAQGGPGIGRGGAEDGGNRDQDGRLVGGPATWGNSRKGGGADRPRLEWLDRAAEVGPVGFSGRAHARPAGRGAPGEAEREGDDDDAG